MDWRHFANRRELAGSLGLVPTPYASGSSEIEQGISKVGNRRVRALLVELAWSWVRLQPAPVRSAGRHAATVLKEGARR